MNILVIGANGRVGSVLTQRLASEGYTVYAAARTPNSAFTHENIRAVSMDITADVATMVQVVKPLNIDVIYFVAGSRGKNLLQVDAFGAVKSMQMAKQLGIQRFILLSSVFALQPERWQEKFLANLTDYNIAKFFADNYLVHQSGLDYTILQPGALQEIAGSGRIQTNVPEPMTNSIENVVATLAALKEADNTIGKVITMADGETPINQALQAI